MSTPTPDITTPPIPREAVLAATFDLIHHGPGYVEWPLTVAEQVLTVAAPILWATWILHATTDDDRSAR